MENQNNQEKYGYIYITENLINGKKYIGQSKYKDNEYKNKNYLGSGKLITEAIKKYGKENFSKIIIDEAYSKEELNEKEIYWIKYYNAVEDPNFYNILKGGHCGLGRPLGSKCTEEEKQRMSLAKLGTKQSLETIEKRILKLKDIPRPESVKIKISLNGRENRKPTKEQILKKIKAITKLAIFNLDKIEYYPNIKEARVKYNVCKLQGKSFEVKFHYNNYWLFLPLNYCPSIQEITNSLFNYFKIHKIIYCEELNKFFINSREAANFLNVKDLSTINNHLNGKTSILYKKFHLNYCNETQILDFINNKFDIEKIYNKIKEIKLNDN